MTKHLRYLFVMLMGLLGVTTGWAEDDAPDVSYDFTTGWSVSNGILTNGTVSFSGQGGANFKMNSGYFMMGKSGAYINFPIYSSDVEKIVVTGREGASASVGMNIFVGNVEVSTATEGATGTNTYEIASGYQAAGTQYTLKVTSNNNTQVTQIDVYFKQGSAPTVATPSFDPIGGIYTEAQSVEISCATEGASIYYTTDGTDPDNQSTPYKSAITVDKDMTIKAIAYSGNDASSIATAEYTIISLDHAGTEADPYSVADAIKVIDNNLTTTDVYVKGTVSTAPTSLSNNGQLSYYISDDGTTESYQLQAYKGYGINGDEFTSVNDIWLGDVVVVYGDLTKFNSSISSIYEFAEGNVLISITEAPSHTATFSVNGTTTTASLKKGAAITFPEDPADIEGKSFVGWTVTAINGTTDDEPDFVTSATMGDQDVTFYAVFANVEGTPEALVKMAAGDTFAEGDNVVIVANVDDETAYGLYQETQSNSYVKNYDFDGSYATVVADDKNWWTVSAGADGKWILGDDTNGYLYSNSSNNLSVNLTNSSEWTLEDNGDGTFGLTQGRYLSCRTDLSGNNANLFRLAGSNPAGVFALDIYKMVGGATYSDYCTTVPESITISAARYATYITTNALDFTDTDVTAFIVDDATTANVHFKEVKKVPAATPIVVKAAAAGTYDIPVTTDDPENVGTNLLLAPVAGQTSKGVEYCLANKTNGIGFYPVKQGVAIKKAYLIISTTGAPEFIGFIEDGGISTGISTVAVENAELNIDAPMYNIAGQRVSRSYKGVVIQNGKKFVVK